MSLCSIGSKISHPKQRIDSVFKETSKMIKTERQNFVQLDISAFKTATNTVTTAEVKYL